VTELSREASVFWPRACIPWNQTLRAIRAGRMGLALKIHDTWSLPSASRLVRLVHARVAIAMDHTPVTTRQSAPIPQCPEGSNFIAYALDRLATWRPAEADEILERYRREIPMDRVMERALDLTIGRGQV
jgi:hypothetical protein